MFLYRCGIFLTLKAFVVTALMPSFLFAMGPNSDSEDENALQTTGSCEATQAPRQPSLLEMCQQLDGFAEAMSTHGDPMPSVGFDVLSSVVVKQEPGTDQVPGITATWADIDVDYSAFALGAPPAPNVSHAQKKRKLPKTAKTPTQPSNTKKRRVTQEPKGKAPMYKSARSLPKRSSQKTSTQKPQPAVQAAATPMDVDDPDYEPSGDSFDTSDSDAPSTPSVAANQTPGGALQLSDEQRAALEMAIALAKTRFFTKPFVVSSHLAFGLLPGHMLTEAQQQMLQNFTYSFEIIQRASTKPTTHNNGVKKEVWNFFNLFALKAYLDYFGCSLDKVLTHGSVNADGRMLCAPFLKISSGPSKLSCNKLQKSFLSLFGVNNSSEKGYRKLRHAFHHNAKDSVLKKIHTLLEKVEWQEQVAAMQANHPKPPVSCLPGFESFDEEAKEQIWSKSYSLGINFYKKGTDLWRHEARSVLQFMQKHNKDFKFAAENKKFLGWLADLCCASDNPFENKLDDNIDLYFLKHFQSFVVWCFFSQAGLLPAANAQPSEAQNIETQQKIATLLAPFLTTKGKDAEKGTDHSIRFSLIYECFVKANKSSTPPLAGKGALLEWLKEKNFLVDRPQDLLSVAQEMLLRDCTGVERRNKESNRRYLPQIHARFHMLQTYDLTDEQKEELQKLQSDTEHLFTIETTQKVGQVCYVKPAMQKLCNFYLLDAYLRKFNRTLSGLDPLDNITQKALKPLWKEDKSLVIEDINLASAFVCAHKKMELGKSKIVQPCYQGLVDVGWQEQVAAMQKPFPTLSVHRPASLELFDAQTKTDVFQAMRKSPFGPIDLASFYSQLDRVMGEQKKIFQRPQQSDNLEKWLKNIGFGPDRLFWFAHTNDRFHVYETHLQTIVLTCLLGQYGVLMEPGADALKPLENKEKCKMAADFLAHFSQYGKSNIYLSFNSFFSYFLQANGLDVFTGYGIQTFLIPWLEKHGFVVTVKAEATQPPVVQAAALNGQGSASTVVSTPATAQQWYSAYQSLQDSLKNTQAFLVSLAVQQKRRQQVKTLMACVKGQEAVIPQQIQKLKLDLDTLNGMIQNRVVRLNYSMPEQHAFFYALQNPDLFGEIRLKQPTMDPTVWLKNQWPEIPFEGTLHLEDVSKLDPYLVNALCALPGVKVLKISDKNNVLQLRREICVSSSTLEDLILENMALNSSSFGLCDQLTSVILKNVRLGGESLKSCQPLENLKKLRLEACNVDEAVMLWIGRQFSLTDLVLRSVLPSGGVGPFECLKNLSHLKHLELIDSHLQPKDLKGIRHLKQLCQFITTGVVLDRDIIEEIVQNSQWYRLMLVASGLTGQNIEPLKQAVSDGKLPRLKTLSLADNKLCAEDVRFIEKMSQLACLSLSDVVQGYRLLPLLNHRHLLMCDLSNTGLILEDIQFLCQGIKKHPLPTKVRKLNLGDNPLQMPALDQLLELWRSPGFNGSIIVVSALISSKEADAINKKCQAQISEAKKQGRTLQPFKVSAGYWPPQRLDQVNCVMHNGTVVRKPSESTAFVATPSVAVAEAAQAPDAAGPAPMDVDEATAA